MSPKRNDPVAPPTTGGEWEIRYGKSDAVAGWAELIRAAPGNALRAWQQMRAEPGPTAGHATTRHHQLKGKELAHGTHGGRTLSRYQIEVTGGGRIWYLLDVDRHIVWLEHVQHLGHPKATE